jgi:predicted TIM-barrel fold metal-dependent hydrolase
MRLEDMILVSVDDHVVEPPDLFEGRLSSKHADVAPKLVRKESGIDVWQFMGAELPNIGLNAVAGRPPEEYAMDPQSFDDMRTGCYDIHDRVKDMNANGLLGSMCFPSFPQFCGQLFARAAKKDEPLAVALVQAYNDWHIESWCGAYPGRFIPLALPMMWDVDKMAAEVRRVADKGCHAVTFSENPEALDMPSIHTKHWYPMFEAACENKTVLCTHVGSSSRSPMMSLDAPPSVAMTASSMMSMFTFVELLWAEFYVDFPEIKFSLTEGDVGWIPYFLWRAEHVYNRHSGWTNARFPDGYSGPSDVFRRHFYTCFISDKVGVKNMDWFNEDMLCWESDFPHSDSNWPFAPEDVMETMGHLDDAVINKITHENAMAAYSFDPFTYIPKDHARAGYLRSQATDVDVVTHVGHMASQRDRDAWTRMTTFARERQAAALTVEAIGIADRATSLGN